MIFIGSQKSKLAVIYPVAE